MTVRAAILACALAASIFTGVPALACGGFVEAPIACDDPDPNAGAAYMLKRVGTALATDKPKALGMITRGEGGFRTADTYVFCVGPDGVMNAHPNPILQGHDVRDLHDKTGNYFIKTMLETAKPGEISVIRYLFPKPGSTIEEPKTTFYTKAGDQMCGVGVYESNIEKPEQSDPQARLASLRRKLDGEIPQSARADWTAFLEELNAQKSAQDAVMIQVRDGLRAAQAILAPAQTPAQDTNEAR